MNRAKTFDPSIIEQLQKLLQDAQRQETKVSSRQVIDALRSDIKSKLDAGWTWDEITGLLTGAGFGLSAATIRGHYYGRKRRASGADPVTIKRAAQAKAGDTSGAQRVRKPRTKAATTAVDAVIADRAAQRAQAAAELAPVAAPISATTQMDPPTQPAAKPAHVPAHMRSDDDI